MLLLVLIIFIATLSQATVGFGFALIAMPLLTLLLGLKTAAPLVAFIGTTNGVLILAQDWREIDLSASWRLILAAALGVPLGLWILIAMPQTLVTRLLGVLLILYSLYQFTRPRLITLRRSGWAYPFGFLAGLLGGAYNVAGPPVILYGVLRRWSPLRFRATLQGFFFPVGLFVFVGHGLAGLWTAAVLRYYLLTLPLIFLATFLGSYLNRRIPAARFERLLYLGLIFVGLLLLW